jgi:hypothetical protein
LIWILDEKHSALHLLLMLRRSRWRHVRLLLLLWWWWLLERGYERIALVIDKHVLLIRLVGGLSYFKEMKIDMKKEQKVVLKISPLLVD